MILVVLLQLGSCWWRWRWCSADRRGLLGAIFAWLCSAWGAVHTPAASLLLRVALALLRAILGSWHCLFAVFPFRPGGGGGS